jgi:hypothetical protein
LDERFRLITGQAIEIEEKAGVFSVKLPLVKVA